MLKINTYISSYNISLGEGVLCLYCNAPTQHDLKHERGAVTFS